ncbi:MAG: FAD-binding protein, partial [Myxococcales bacterium]|nr:FAD-binding protein [Myxococcales bacterium]
MPETAPSASSRPDWAHPVDFLVLGTGVAGLMYALKAAQHGRVMVVSKVDRR